MCKDLKKLNLTDSDKAQIAFFAGLILGWATRLEKITHEGHNVETFKLIEEMKTESARLADLAGVVRN